MEALVVALVHSNLEALEIVHCPLMDGTLASQVEVDLTNQEEGPYREY